jgi:hypothetical protein
MHLHHDRHFMSMHHLFVILWPPLLATNAFTHVLLMPNSKHLTYSINNLVSLITKTKLGLSEKERTKASALLLQPAAMAGEQRVKERA